MKFLSHCLLVTILSCVFTGVPLAQADLLCAKVKQKRGKLRLKKRIVSEDSCPRGFTELIDTEELRGEQGAEGPQGEQGESGSSNILCWASFTTSGPPTVRNFGGEVTTSVEATRNGIGDYTLKCNGDFSGVGSLFEVAVMSTLDSSTAARGVTASVSSANLGAEGHYTVDIETFNTTTGAGTDTGTIVITLLGDPPA